MVGMGVGGGWREMKQDWQKDNQSERNTSTATFTESVLMRQIRDEACAVIDHKWSTASWCTQSLGSQHGWSNLILSLSAFMHILSLHKQETDAIKTKSD